MNFCNVTKVISGGQTGVDRAGLDFAIENGIEHGGWCPKGRTAQDGIVPLRYQLLEAERTGYPYRTKKNVMDSDGTVVFTSNPPGRGSSLTIQTCLDFGRPYLVITLEESLQESCMHLLGFLRRNNVRVLNVAGSRQESYYRWAKLVLQKSLNEAEKRWPAHPCQKTPNSF